MPAKQAVINAASVPEIIERRPRRAMRTLAPRVDRAQDGEKELEPQAREDQAEADAPAVLAERERKGHHQEKAAETHRSRP